MGLATNSGESVALHDALESFTLRCADYVHERNAGYHSYLPPSDGQPAQGEKWDWKSIDIPMLFNIGTDLTDQLRLKGFVGPTFVYRFSYEGNYEQYGEYYSQVMQSVNVFVSLGTSLEWNELLRLKIGVDWCPFDMSVDGFESDLEQSYLTEWRLTAGLSLILPTAKRK